MSTASANAAPIAALLCAPPVQGLQRHPAWPMHLAALLADARDRPFRWAAHDCCTFAADAVRAMTGTDPMAVLRGRYTSGLEAARFLRELGGLRQAVTDRLGSPVPARLAARGDVVVFDTRLHGEALGICVGAQFAAPGPRGLELIDMSVARAAWKVSP